MKKYESITSFIERFEGDYIGERHGGRMTNEGCHLMPYVAYSSTVDEFRDAVRAFMDEHQEMELYQYLSIMRGKCNDFLLEELDQLWRFKIGVLDERTVMALIVGIIRGERFCDGMMLCSFEDGTVRKCLERLKEIDDFVPDQEAISSAHQYSANHREDLEKDEVCGCFHCCRTFSPKLIKKWTDGGQTAICPHCGIDAVIGESSGYPVAEEFLQAMNKEWF